MFKPTTFLPAFLLLVAACGGDDVIEQDVIADERAVETGRLPLDESSEESVIEQPIDEASDEGSEDETFLDGTPQPRGTFNSCICLNPDRVRDCRSGTCYCARKTGGTQWVQCKKWPYFRKCPAYETYHCPKK